MFICTGPAFFRGALLTHVAWGGGLEKVSLNCLSLQTRASLPPLTRIPIIRSKIQSRANMYSIDTMLSFAKVMTTPLGWSCSKNGRYTHPQAAFAPQLGIGSCSRGGQKKRYKDMSKTSTKLFHIESDTWEDLVLYRSIWRSRMKIGAKVHEEHRIDLAEQKSATQKVIAASEAPPSGPLCPECGKAFHARMI